jgi:hypothetical protein
VEPATHYQSPQERRVGHGGMSPGNPFAIKLGMLARLHAPGKLLTEKTTSPSLNFGAIVSEQSQKLRSNRRACQAESY